MRDFDIAPDGQRFFLLQGNTTRDTTEIQVIANWFSELERLVPTQ